MPNSWEVSCLFTNIILSGTYLVSSSHTKDLHDETRHKTVHKLFVVYFKGVCQDHKESDNISVKVIYLFTSCFIDSSDLPYGSEYETCQYNVIVLLSISSFKILFLK
jgi:hypothetical protein